MATSFDNSRQIVEVELPFVRRNKRTFFDASHEAMCIALSVGKSLAPDKREQFCKVIECIAMYESILESL